MTGRPNNSSHDPWADWAIENKASAAPVRQSSRLDFSDFADVADFADVSDFAETPAPPAVWSTNFEGVDENEHGEEVVAARNGVLGPPLMANREPIEDYTGEFEEIESGNWDDTKFQYLDDDQAYTDLDDSAELTVKPPLARNLQAKQSPKQSAKQSPSSGPAPAVKPAKGKAKRSRRILKRVGISLVTVMALLIGYVAYQFSTIRRNEADGQVLDRVGVVKPTVPNGIPTTVGGDVPVTTVTFNDLQPVDTFPVVTNPGPTTPVVTVPGEGTCADDPACANAPVVILPEAEKPRQGGLLVDKVNVVPIGGADAVNILLIGSDSRADLPDAQKAGFGQVGGHRSDTIIVLRMSQDGKVAALLSFPRDTYVHLSGQDKNDRINSAYAKGVNSLIRTIQENFNVPITHSAEIDFNGFQSIVGTLGGIEICFKHPARDAKTNLNVKEPGCQTLNRTQATAYVRSRHYEQLINGAWVSDGRGDIGRVQRQQQFIKQVLQKVIDTGGRNPIQAQALISDLKGAITLDKTWGITELFGTAKTFSNFDPSALQPFTLPTSGANIDGKAVLRVNRPKASEMVAKFGTRT
jgi:LCP family protein required for cell wall assembly